MFLNLNMLQALRGASVRSKTTEHTPTPVQELFVETYCVPSAGDKTKNTRARFQSRWTWESLAWPAWNSQPSGKDRNIENDFTDSRDLMAPRRHCQLRLRGLGNIAVGVPMSQALERKDVVGGPGTARAKTEAENRLAWELYGVPEGGAGTARWEGSLLSRRRAGP